MTKLFVSHCNGKPGYSYIDTATGHQEKRGIDLDTRGIVFAEGVLYALRHRSGLWLITPDTGEPGRLIADINNDWHGLTYHEGRLWGVDPVSDTIVEFLMSGKFVQRWHWKRDPDAGRQHINDIAMWEDEIWQCAFNSGICRDGVPTGFGHKHQPHSIKHWDGHAIYCASNKGEVRRFPHDADEDFEEDILFANADCFTRGLLPTSEGLWIGQSMKRHGAGGSEARVTLMSWEGEHLEWYDFPETNEVYAICQAD